VSAGRWTLGEYQKTLSKKYQDLNLYEIPITKLTSNSPTIIVHRIERSHAPGVKSGAGVECLKAAITNLVEFFSSEINLSIMIEPTQFRNNRVSPSILKARKEFSSKRLIDYFRESIQPPKTFGVRSLFLPIGYSDLSD